MTGKSTRIHEIDAVRGIALFGILLVNIFVFHAPYAHYSTFYGAFTGWQELALGGMLSLAAGKFLFLFSFLFGYGIQLQSKSKGDSFTSYHFKRMVILFLFGVIHILVFWFGDILANYAVLGLLIMPFLKWNTSSLIILSVCIYAIRPLYYFGVVLFGWPTIGVNPPADLDTFVQTFSSGDYLDIARLRMLEWTSFQLENLIWYIPKTFATMILGMAASKWKLSSKLVQYRGWYTKMGIGLLLIVLLWAFFKGSFFALFDMEAQPLWRPVLIGLNLGFEVVQGCVYFALFFLLFSSFQTLRQPMAATGRLALTNYILQSMICVLIFYGFGWGLYGSLHPTDLIWITLVVFIVQVLMSKAYLTQYKFGPLEWLWRWLIKKI